MELTYEWKKQGSVLHVHISEDIYMYACMHIFIYLYIYLYLYVDITSCVKRSAIFWNDEAWQHLSRHVNES